MDENKRKEAMNAEYGPSDVMDNGRVFFDLAPIPVARFPYNPNMDGGLFYMRFMTPEEIREGAKAVFSERYGFGREKSQIHIDQKVDHDRDVYGYAFRDTVGNTIVIVEYNYMVTLIQYKENEFSVSRFAEGVELVEIAIKSIMNADKEEEAKNGQE